MQFRRPSSPALELAEDALHGDAGAVCGPLARCHHQVPGGQQPAADKFRQNLLLGVFEFTKPLLFQRNRLTRDGNLVFESYIEGNSRVQQELLSNHPSLYIV